MPTLLLSGYYGFGNLGDEAILAASVEALRAERPDLDIEVLSADPERTAQQYGVRATPRSNPAHILAAVRRADLLLSGGGGLIQDATSRSSPLYYLGILRLAQLMGRKTMVLAQGIGPLQSARNIAWTISTFGRADAITVRDEASAVWLCERGIPESRIVLSADPALLLQPCPQHQARDILARHNVPQGLRTMGLSIRPWRTAPDLGATMAALIAELASELDAHIILLPFHPQMDVPLCEQVAAGMGGRATVLSSTLSPAEVLGVIAQLDLLLGMRLHSLILAAVAATPLLGISYDPKVDAFLASLGLQAAASVETLDPPAMLKAARGAVAGAEGQRQRLQERVEALKEAALRSIHAAFRLID